MIGMTNMTITLSGLIHQQLKQEIKELKFNNKETNYIILKIMKGIGEINHKRWIKKCSILFLTVVVDIEPWSKLLFRVLGT